MSVHDPQPEVVENTPYGKFGSGPPPLRRPGTPVPLNWNVDVLPGVGGSEPEGYRYMFVFERRPKCSTFKLYLRKDGKVRDVILDFPVLVKKKRQNVTRLSSPV